MADIKTQAELEELLNDTPGLLDHISGKAKEMATAEIEKAQRDRTPVQRVAHPEPEGGLPDADVAFQDPNLVRGTKGFWAKSGAAHLDITKAPNAWLGGDQGRSSLRRMSQELNGQFANFGDFLTCINPVAQRYQGGGFDKRLKVLGEGQGDQGGFLVPEQYVANLLTLVLEMAVVRPRAFVMPMASPTVRIPSVKDTTHASNVHGGVQAYWTPESGSFTASEPSFSQVVLNAHKLVGYTTVSNELLMDSALPLEALVNRLFSEALAYFEDDAFIQGTGAGQPIGILNADALVSVSKESGQAATTIVTENLDKMWSRLLPTSQSNAVWLAHPDTFPQLAALARAVGTGGSSVWMANVAGSPPASIFGRPVIFTEKCQTLGTVGDIMLADFSYYVIGDRMGFEMSASPHVRFTNDETVYRFVQRVDGKPWIESALTPRQGSNTLSPFVALATRA